MKARAELTPEQYIEAVAKIIAVKKMLDEQMEKGEVVAVEKKIPVAQIYGFGTPLVVYQMVLALEGNDLTNAQSFFELRDQLENRSTEALAVAETNEKVAKAREDYSLFKRKQTVTEQAPAPAQQNQDRPESPDLDKDNEEPSLERMTL